MHLELADSKITATVSILDGKRGGEKRGCLKLTYPLNEDYAERVFAAFRELLVPEIPGLETTTSPDAGNHA